MLRRIGVILLALVFVSSMSWVAASDTGHATPQCQCKGDGKDCQCGPDCKCPHCAARKDSKGCQCGKDCKCEHCKTGKGTCQCAAGAKGCQCKSDGKGGCQCGKGCNCGHCAGGAGAAAMAKPAGDAAYAKTMTSKTGAFKATYMSDPEAIPVNKIISWKLKVETADGKAVKDAKITVVGAMPEHGHGLPTEPKVSKDSGDGTYLVEGIKFSMPGWWTMTFTVKAAGKTDKVTFNLQLE